MPLITWDKMTHDIKPLLNHSDCDGVLTPDECRQVAPALRRLVAEWPEDDYDRIHFQLLADGMDEASRKEEDLEFC